MRYFIKQEKSASGWINDRFSVMDASGNGVRLIPLKSESTGLSSASKCWIKAVQVVQENGVFQERCGFH